MAGPNPSTVLEVGAGHTGTTGRQIEFQRSAQPLQRMMSGTTEENVPEQQNEQQNQNPEEAPPGEEEIVDAEVVDEDPTEGDASDETTDEAPESDDAALAAERLADLQRLQADYVNFKRRVERDRGRDREAGIGSVIEALLPVMDDIHSAREHGELTDGPVAAIAEKIEATLGRFGVERVGAVGDAFDPNRHEALMHLPDAELPDGATGTTVVQVFQPGFVVADRLVRAARVAVADGPEGSDAGDGGPELEQGNE